MVKEKRLYLYKGKMLTLQQIADEVNVEDYILRNRLRNGWTVEKAINTPVIWQKRCDIDIPIDWEKLKENWFSRRPSDAQINHLFGKYYGARKEL